MWVPLSPSKSSSKFIQVNTIIFSSFRCNLYVVFSIAVSINSSSRLLWRYIYWSVLKSWKSPLKILQKNVLFRASSFEKFHQLAQLIKDAVSVNVFMKEILHSFSRWGEIDRARLFLSSMTTEHITYAYTLKNVLYKVSYCCFIVAEIYWKVHVFSETCNSNFSK